MPYVTQDVRERFDDAIDTFPLAITAGQMNYVLTRLIDQFSNAATHPSYDGLNEAIGVLECVKQEFYRRRMTPYEDIKKETNGDVYD